MKPCIMILDISREVSAIILTGFSQRLLIVIVLIALSAALEFEFAVCATTQVFGLQMDYSRKITIAISLGLGTPWVEFFVTSPTLRLSLSREQRVLNLWAGLSVPD